MNNNINFPALEFTAPGVYSYTIKELTPSNRQWETDSRVYRVIITVTDNGEGLLVASLDYPDGFPKFVNKSKCVPPPPPPPPPPPDDPCIFFHCLPFPMFLFVPPQKPEFTELVKSSPHIITWWENLFKDSDSRESSNKRDEKQKKNETIGCGNAWCDVCNNRNSGGF